MYWNILSFSGWFCHHQLRGINSYDSEGLACLLIYPYGNGEVVRCWVNELRSECKSASSRFVPLCLPVSMFSEWLQSLSLVMSTLCLVLFILLRYFSAPFICLRLLYRLSLLDSWFPAEQVGWIVEPVCQIGGCVEDGILQAHFGRVSSNENTLIHNN